MIKVNARIDIENQLVLKLSKPSKLVLKKKIYRYRK